MKRLAIILAAMAVIAIALIVGADTAGKPAGATSNGQVCTTATTSHA